MADLLIVRLQALDNTGDAKVVVSLGTVQRPGRVKKLILIIRTDKDKWDIQLSTVRSHHDTVLSQCLNSPDDQVDDAEVENLFVGVVVGNLLLLLLDLPHQLLSL